MQYSSLEEKIIRGERLNVSEGIELYKLPLSRLSWLSDIVRGKRNGKRVYFVRNFHIEPTNTCAYHCLFCSYSGVAGLRESWELTADQIRRLAEEGDPSATEIHITGGAHPQWGIEEYCNILRAVREVRPNIHIKAFSAVEIHHLHSISDLSYSEILQRLLQAGLNSLPGGGAEIFDSDIRLQICPEKANAEEWLEVHRTAHRMGIPSNATMLYGHIETYRHRIMHMEQLRMLQDETSGFNAFIPLKFRKANNKMSDISEVSLMEDLRNYAVARIFLDNIPHLKAYWPMLGKQAALFSLLFGVDDLDGTIQDSTKIYTMAGIDEKPVMTAEEMCTLIEQAGKEPCERDALYHAL
jgi:aminodeoxyfutalosine synthase